MSHATLKASFAWLPMTRQTMTQNSPLPAPLWAESTHMQKIVNRIPAFTRAASPLAANQIVPNSATGAAKHAILRPRSNLCCSFHHAMNRLSPCPWNSLLQESSPAQYLQSGCPQGFAVSAAWDEADVGFAACGSVGTGCGWGFSDASSGLE